MAEEPGPRLFTLAEVLKQFKGAIGKTRLVAHLKVVPSFAGGPTHRRLPGGKYLFTEADIGRFIESLASGPPAEPTHRSQSLPTMPSEEKLFLEVSKTLQKHIANSKQKTQTTSGRRKAAKRSSHAE